MQSTTLGLPSPTLNISLHEIPLLFKISAVPLVAIILNPISWKSLAIWMISFLSELFTEMKIVPLSGKTIPAPNSALEYAEPKCLSNPITSKLMLLF